MLITGELKDLYADYLLCSTGLTTATGLSQLTNNSISHDKVTRLLNGEEFNSKELWKRVKPIVREFESADGVIGIDDSIAEKPYTDENELICWHYDHSKGRSVKGINFITASYAGERLALPLIAECVRKDQWITDEKTGKRKRKSSKTKNELYREILLTIVQHNQVKFGYVVNDIWFSSADNMNFVKKEIKKNFGMAIKENRLVALNEKDKQEGKYVSTKSLKLQEGQTVQVYLTGVDFPLLLAKKIFTNKDKSTGILYVVCSDLRLTYEQIITIIYHKRWKVEEYHQSLKSNASLEKAPVKTVTTQLSHFYASLVAYIKMVRLQFKTQMNHHALKMKIYFSGLQHSMMELEQLKLSTYPIA